MTFGRRLRELRKEKGLTQKELGDQLNLADRTIGYYEADEHFPDEPILHALADFFKVPMDYLLGRSNVRLLHDDDPIPHEWMEGVAFMRRAGTVLTDDEKKDLLDMAGSFIRTVERKKRQQEGL